MKLFGYAKSYRRVSGLLLVSLLACPMLLSAQNRVSFCFNDWPPYAGKNNGKADGISIRIIREAGRRLGYQTEFIELPWNDCLQQVKDGKLDAVIDAAKREEYLQGPASFSVFTDTFWVKNDSPFERYSDLSGASIGLVDGYNYNSRLMSQLTSLGMTIVYAEDDATNIAKLARGQVDTIIADLASTFVSIGKQKIPAHPILPPFSTDPLYLSFNRQKPVLQRDFDKVFTDLLKQGYIDATYLEFIGTRYSSFVNSP